MNVIGRLSRLLPLCIFSMCRLARTKYPIILSKLTERAAQFQDWFSGRTEQHVYRTMNWSIFAGFLLLLPMITVSCHFIAFPNVSNREGKNGFVRQITRRRETICAKNLVVGYIGMFTFLCF